MNAIIKWTVWQRRMSTFWWSFGTAFFLFINLIFYPSFKNQAAELEKSFENIPDTAVQLFGGSTDFFSPVGFLNSQIFYIMLPLLLGILAISLGSNLLAREEQDHTIDTLMARPVSRSRLLGAKALAGLVILSIIAVISLIVTMVFSKATDIAVPLPNIAAATLVCFLLAISFGAVSFLLTALGRARGASMGIGAVIALGGYIVSSLAGAVDWLEWPGKMFPFHYYQPEAILRGTYDWINTLFLIAVIVICAVLSWLVFRKRDLL